MDDEPTSLCRTTSVTMKSVPPRIASFSGDIRLRTSLMSTSRLFKSKKSQPTARKFCGCNEKSHQTPTTVTPPLRSPGSTKHHHTRTRKKGALIPFVRPHRRHSGMWAGPECCCSLQQSPGTGDGGGGGAQEQTQHTSQRTSDANRSGHSPPGPTWQWVVVVSVLTQPGSLTLINKWYNMTWVRCCKGRRTRTPCQSGSRKRLQAREAWQEPWHKGGLFLSEKQDIIAMQAHFLLGTCSYLVIINLLWSQTSLLHNWFKEALIMVFQPTLSTIWNQFIQLSNTTMWRMGNI